MDYQNKYLKYKMKYLDLKNNIYGCSKKKTNGLREELLLN